MGESLSVLIVEDNDADAELIRLELKRGEFELRWTRVETEAELREQLSQHRWDLIISDFAMPAFDGLRAFDVYKEMGFDTPFIFVSGALGEERAVAAMRAGARDYLLKGNLGRLNAAVRRELQEATNRRSLEKAKLESEQKQALLEAALAATGAGLLESSLPENDRLYVSERFADMLGYKAREIQARKPVLRWLADQVHPGDLKEAQGSFEEFRTGKQQSAQFNLRFQHRTGHWLHIACYVIGIAWNEEGNVTQAVTVVLDTSENKQLQERYLQAQKMEAIGKLAGGIAHDFNNLLTAIISYAGFVRDGLPAEGQGQEDISEVLSAADRAAGLTRQLLLFSKQQPAHLQSINVGVAIANIEKLLLRTIGEDIEFVAIHSPKSSFVLADQGQFDQILMNLVVNARDAMPQGGTIHLSFESIELSEREALPLELTAGVYVQILVADTGHGIDEHIISKIFEPFFSTKGRQEGTGLGLATSYGIARQFGGVIDVESELDTGSTFRVLLPRIESEIHKEPVPLGTGRTHSGTETILVVEDERALRRIVDRCLKKLGYTVLLAEDAVMGMTLFEAHREAIDLVFSDIVLPKGNGYDLATRIHLKDPNMPILLTSGYTDRRAIRTEERFEILWKPYTPPVLVGRIRASLDRR